MNRLQNAQTNLACAELELNSAVEKHCALLIELLAAKASIEALRKNRDKCLDILYVEKAACT